MLRFMTMITVMALMAMMYMLRFMTMITVMGLMTDRVKVMIVLKAVMSVMFVDGSYSVCL
jgi:hypothetical protein